MKNDNNSHPTIYDNQGYFLCSSACIVPDTTYKESNIFAIRLPAGLTSSRLEPAEVVGGAKSPGGASGMVIAGTLARVLATCWEGQQNIAVAARVAGRLGEG